MKLPKYNFYAYECINCKCISNFWFNTNVGDQLTDILGLTNQHMLKESGLKNGCSINTLNITTGKFSFGEN